MPTSRAFGDAAEERAAQFLRARGMTVLARHFRFHQKEIDLIARDGAETVFVEVKARRSEAFGSGVASIHRGKQHHLRMAIEHYRQQYLREEDPVRVDVVSINPDGTIEHLKGVELG